jgi:hypothetical protein
MNNPVQISESLETIIFIKLLKFLDADPGSVMEKFGSSIGDGKNSDPGSWMDKTRIRDKHPRSATLFSS